MGKVVDIIFEKVKTFININSNENIIKLNIELIVQESLNYMNRKDFPNELILTIAKYIADNNSKEGTIGLKAMSVGDTKIEYIEIDPAFAILDLKKQLNRFRKVGTV